MASAVELEILEKRQRLAVLQARKRVVEENGINFYKPHHKQDLFHQAGRYKRRYVRTGNRFGKSDMGAAEDVAFALGYRPWYPEGNPARYEGIPKHSTKGCIIVADWDKAHEIFTNTEPGKSRGKLFRFLPKDKIVSVKKGRSGTGIAEIVIKSIHGGHSTINLETVRSYVQNPMGLESSDWDWVHVDEPCPQSMWVAVERGLIDRDGSAWFACTPIAEAWINDYFIPRSLTRATFDEPHKDDRQLTWVITGSSRDNPHISKKALELYAEKLTDEERACRIQGIPMALSGLVYKDFDPSVHIYRECPHGWTDEQTPPTHYTIRTYVDCHPRVPHAVLHFATAPNETTFIFREMFRPGTIEDIAQHIKAQVEGYHVEQYMVDPSAWIPHPVTGTCMADEFNNAGIPVEPAPKDLSYGIIKTQSKLRERDEQGIPTILVHESCEEFLYEIDRYSWQTDKEKPVDKNDHMMENLYRAVLGGLSYVKNEGYNFNPRSIEVTSASWREGMREITPFDTSLPSAGKNYTRSQRYPG